MDATGEDWTSRPFGGCAGESPRAEPQGVWIGHRRVAKEVQPVKESTVTVGMDVHRDTITLAVLRDWSQEPEFLKTLPHDPQPLRRVFDRLKETGSVRACYEASGCGYVLQREVERWGVPCTVIAPSLIPSRPGDRRKTDSRDAVNLARLFRAGELTAVRVPTEEEEGVRALLRCRDAVSQEVKQSKQRILKHLYARGLVYRGGTNWTRKHLAWIQAQTLGEHDAWVLRTHMHLLEAKQGHLGGLEKRIEELALDPVYRGPVARLCCLKGVRTLTAMGLVAGIADVRRFGTPRALMGYVGLTVSEYSSGGSERRGGITKAGSGHLRRLLVEAAWSYRRPTSFASRALMARRRDQDPAVVEHARRADARLHRRFVRLAERMPSPRAVTAVARELVGFVWAILWNEPHLLRAARNGK
jgi:transposase